MKKILFQILPIFLIIEKLFGKETVYSYTTRETSTCDDRSISGLICQSCELIATCIKVNGEWLTVPVETCEDGFYCNLSEQGCSNATGPCHPFGFEGNFACTSEGVFPDPYDCQKYHLCYKAGSTIVSANIECGGDKAFSAATGDCSFTISDPVCKKKQYECLNAGDSRSWPGNLNIFYICKATSDNKERILYPTLYRCASGEVFNDRDCVSRSDYTGPLGPLSPNDSAGQDTPFLCKKAGIYKDPSDCHSYYACDIFLNARSFKCPANTYFNEKKKVCVRGTC